MSRTSSSSDDASSTISDATTIAVTATATTQADKGLEPKKADQAHQTLTQPQPQSSATASTSSMPPSQEHLQQRRGFRQKARDVFSDMGAPPTRRQDAKEGKHTSNFADLGLLSSTGFSAPSRT